MGRMKYTRPEKGSGELQPPTEPPGEEKAKGKMPVRADAKAKGKMPVKADAKAKGKMTVKADAKAKGKMPVKANKKTDGKKIVASEKLKIGGSGERETTRKRKVMSHEGNLEASGSQVKKVKTRNKNETDKGAVGTTRVLRSNSAKKGGEAGKEAVKKYSAKGKTRKQSVEAITPSAAVKGSCSLVDFTCPESTGKRATRVGTKRQVELQKNVKGKNILKRNESEEEADSDDESEAGRTIGSPKPKKTLTVKKAEPSKRTTRKVGNSKDALSQEHVDDSTAGASSSKTGAKQVSKAKKKKGGVQASNPSRKNPTRKVREAAKTKDGGVSCRISRVWTVKDDAYFIFLKDYAKTYYEKNPPAPTKGVILSLEVEDIIILEWTGMSARDKAPYIQRAKEMREAGCRMYVM